MKDGRRNQHGGNCVACGQWVEAGDGLLERRETEGGYGWAVVHDGECPAPRRRKSDSEMPRWAVYPDGVVPIGPASTVRLVDSATRPPGSVPVNEAAMKVAREGQDA